MQDQRYYLEIAMAEAELAFQERTYPVGAVLVGPDGEILARGRNRVMARGDYTHHAEIDVIRQVGLRVREPAYKHQCTLYTSTEPCLMCLGAALFVDIDKLAWAMNDDMVGAVRSLMHGPYRPHQFARLEIVAAPFPDLDRRQREMHAAWDYSTGRDGARWFRSVAAETAAQRTPHA